MAKTIKAPDEFTAAMQHLSAEAEKILPPNPREQNDAVLSDDKGTPHVTEEFGKLGSGLEILERALSKKIDKLAAAISSAQSADLAPTLEKIDEHLVAIRNTERVNERLFDSLHEELLKYRDNFLHESLQKPFIHDLVHLFDDLTSLSGQLRSAAEEEHQRGHAAQWRDNLENAIHSLMEILHRFEVKEIEPKENVDRAFHRVVNFEPADFPEEDGRIVMRVKRGFVWRGKLIRPEEVIAKRFG
jgi:molecular chaperone GrpE (heat shock protein)